MQRMELNPYESPPPAPTTKVPQPPLPYWLDLLCLIACAILPAPVMFALLIGGILLYQAIYGSYP
jgi:hypothetical protein